MSHNYRLWSNPWYSCLEYYIVLIPLTDNRKLIFLSTLVIDNSDLDDKYFINQISLIFLKVYCIIIGSFLIFKFYIWVSLSLILVIISMNSCINLNMSDRMYMTDCMYIVFICFNIFSIIQIALIYFYYSNCYNLILYLMLYLLLTNYIYFNFI
jgi:hypothetical protein